MTVRDFRRMLFNVENQELTVKELWDILLQSEEQDEELTEEKIMEVTK